MTEENNVPIIIAQRDIRMPLKCPHCEKWGKEPIISVKTLCSSCKKEFEKNPLDDEINTVECLRDAAWVALRLFATQDEIQIQYGDNHKEKADMLIAIFTQAFGLEAHPARQKNIFAKKLNKHIIVNEVVVYKPEHIIYYGKK